MVQPIPAFCLCLSISALGYKPCYMEDVINAYVKKNSMSPKGEFDLKEKIMTHSYIAPPLLMEQKSKILVGKIIVSKEMNSKPFNITPCYCNIQQAVPCPLSNTTSNSGEVKRQFISIVNRAITGEHMGTRMHDFLKAMVSDLNPSSSHAREWKPLKIVPLALLAVITIIINVMVY